MHILFGPLSAAAAASECPEEFEGLGGDPLRLRVRVSGLVQGVGFRPFVHRMASRIGVAGSVRNTLSGVEIEAEGSRAQISRLLEAIRHESPAIAQVQRIDSAVLESTGELGFRIVESTRSSAEPALVSADIGTCDDCVQELRNPNDRRYRYPFTNCTNCGPRFTIVESVPYDRARTTMRGFELCAACAREYGDVSDRRFHAEPIACPICGPRPTLLDSSGHSLAEGDSAVERAREMLGCGRIVGVKGLGGFHLACDATSDGAVSRLRRSKGRPHKPFAVMCRDLECARDYCRVSATEAQLLECTRRPILLLERRRSPRAGLAPIAQAVAPGLDQLGVLLPYTPLHHLLFERQGFACLVMTSGNRSGEPIVVEDGEAVAKLGGIAAAFLTHDRPVSNRCDDSVGFVDDDNLVLTRRSRGFAPLPVALKRAVAPTLALGAMTNNTIALAAGRRVFLSQHIGDVDNAETLAFLREAVENLRRWQGIDPAVVAHDLHPDLLTTHLAHQIATGRRRIAVQHHHAHFAAALAAAAIEGEAQGLVLDGTGWGPDRTIWGGELFVGSAGRAQRAGHLRLLPLPGNEAAIRRPLRLAIAYIETLMPSAASAPLEVWRRASAEEVSVVRRMVRQSFNTPLTSSAGRLFDAVAALLGVRDEVTYEGQAAVELEQLARQGHRNRGPALRLQLKEQGGVIIIDPESLVCDLVDALLDKCNRADLALGFHLALANSLASACARVRDRGGPVEVVLCGGVFQNRILTRLTGQALQAADLQPISPGLIPINDAGLALGQVLAANAMAQEEGT